MGLNSGRQGLLLQIDSQSLIGSAAIHSCSQQSVELAGRLLPQALVDVYLLLLNLQKSMARQSRLRTA